MNFPDSDLLSAFGEAIVTIDQTRCITASIGDVETIFGSPASKLDHTAWADAIADSATPEAVASLYWAVEALFEGYIADQFVPSFFPFRSEHILKFTRIADRGIGARIVPSKIPDIETYFRKVLRPSLTSVVGFADVLLKGIGGPLSDVQMEDLGVISRDSQFALDLLDDFRAHYLLPGLSGPVPINVRDLLALGVDDVPRRRLSSQRLTLDYDLPDTLVYSNGAIRWTLIALIQQLAQMVLYQSKIMIIGRPNGEMLELAVIYQPTDAAMHATYHVLPAKLSNRREIKHAERLLNVISSLQMQLEIYGCTAWAEPTEHSGASKIVMTVPLWNGPAVRPA